MITDYLTDEDEDWAFSRACTLQDEASKNPNKHGAKRRNQSYQDDLNMHLQGQRGEIFAARQYGVTATFHVNVYHSHVPDIGKNGQVRTRSEDWHDLIVRKDDWDDHYYILVIGGCERGSTLTLVGGIHGKDAKQDKWCKDPSGDGTAWFVPQAALETPEDLLRRWSK